MTLCQFCLHPAQSTFSASRPCCIYRSVSVGSGFVPRRGQAGRQLSVQLTLKFTKRIVTDLLSWAALLTPHPQLPHTPFPAHPAPGAAMADPHPPSPLTAPPSAGLSPPLPPPGAPARAPLLLDGVAATAASSPRPS
jgi:hypothetical protein